jgi:hypothetical protein
VDARERAGLSVRGGCALLHTPRCTALSFRSHCTTPLPPPHTSSFAVSGARLSLPARSRPPRVDGVRERRGTSHEPEYATWAGRLSWWSDGTLAPAARPHCPCPRPTPHPPPHHLHVASSSTVPQSALWLSRWGFFKPSSIAISGVFACVTHAPSPFLARTRSCFSDRLGATRRADPSKASPRTTCQGQVQ